MPNATEKIIYSVELPSQDGFNLTAYIVEDDDFDPETSYDTKEFADHIAAWKRDEWRGVGLIVEASRGGVVLGDADIWGSEYGIVDGKHVQPIGEDGTDNIGYLQDKIGEALDEARAKLKEIS